MLTEPSDKPCCTFEELFDMTSEQLLAMNDDQLLQYLQQAIEDTDRILASVPKKKATPTIVNNTKASAPRMTPVATAVLQQQLAARGIDMNKLKAMMEGKK